MNKQQNLAEAAESNLASIDALKWKLFYINVVRI